jgi:hypothetical protein
MEMDPAVRESKLTELKDALKKAEDDHNELLKGLQVLVILLITYVPAISLAIPKLTGFVN